MFKQLLRGCDASPRRLCCVVDTALQRRAPSSKMRAAVLVVLLGASRGLVPRRPVAPRPASRRHATAVEPSPVETAVRSLADVTLSLLAGEMKVHLDVVTNNEGASPFHEHEMIAPRCELDLLPRCQF